MSSLYGNTPNVIYEIANEPNGDVNWKRDIKRYAEEVISVIRKMIQTTSSLSEPVRGARM